MWTFEATVHEFKYVPSMGKEFVPQLGVHWDCWLMGSWLQRLGICKCRATDHLLVFLCVRQDQTQATWMLSLSSSFLLLVWHSKVCQRMAILRVTTFSQEMCWQELQQKGLQQHRRAVSVIWISQWVVGMCILKSLPGGFPLASSPLGLYSSYVP